MPKIYLVVKTEESYEGCYYEGDRPSVTKTIIDSHFNQTEAIKLLETAQKIQKIRNEKSGYKGYSVNYWFDIEEFEVSKPVIKWLWDNRDA